MSFQAVAKSTNSASLVIGEISDREAEIAAFDNPFVDGKGLYLISVDGRSETGIGNVLAKFVSEEAAHEVAQFFRLTGRLEPA
jgi:hypothetical protein